MIHIEKAEANASPIVKNERHWQMESVKRLEREEHAEKISWKGFRVQ